MASDLFIFKKEESRNPCGVPESIVDMTMEMVVFSCLGAIVDNVDAISPLLARQVSSKAFRLLVDYKKLGSPVLHFGHGQAGLIRQEQIGESPEGLKEYSVVPITAKHNLRRNKEYNAQPNPKMLLGVGESLAFDATFQDVNWMATLAQRISLWPENHDSKQAFWKFGLDIVVGSKIGSIGDFFTKQFYSFAAVGKSFIPRVGMKVGIAVVFPAAAKPTKWTVAGAGEVFFNIDDEKLPKIYGHPNVPNIYTGTITFVGEGTNHIEYDLNCFTGCAGAVVFLLDQEQPVSVDPSDYGKAIAIHAGGHPTIAIRNMGFLISSVLP